MALARDVHPRPFRAIVADRCEPKPKEPTMKVLVVFYSTYGHIYRMAQAVAEGAREVAGANVILRRVPETQWEATRRFLAVSATGSFM